MRHHILDQIKNADRFYAIPLGNRSPNSGVQRFAIYFLKDGKLDVLWPRDTHENNGKKELSLVPGLVYSTRKQYPAYHFRLSGFGYSKIGEIRDTLRTIRDNKPTELEILNGTMPSQHD